jgi:hypothetical protein
VPIFKFERGIMFEHHLTKGELMRFTGNDRAVDSALPEPWLDKVVQLGFDRHEILFSYGYSYKDNSLGRPISLPMAFILELQERRIKLLDEDGKSIIRGEWKDGKCIRHESCTIMELVKSLLDSTDEWEIKLKKRQ